MRHKLAPILRGAVVAALAATAAACVSVPDAPTLPLSPEYLNGAHLRGVTGTSKATWLSPVDNFSEALSDELNQGVRTCMGGGGPALDLRYHVLHIDSREIRGQGSDPGRTVLTLRGRAELFDPQRRKVVGRFHIAVSTETPWKFQEDGRSVARAFTDDLCRQAFGRPAANYVTLPTAPSPPPSE